MSELIEIAGGEDVLPKLRFQQAAKDRIISPDAVREAAPDVILASWCGKKVVPDRIRNRPGWSEIPAVRNDRIVEIKSPLILQPGPAALTGWPRCHREGVVAASNSKVAMIACECRLTHANRDDRPFVFARPRFAPSQKSRAHGDSSRQRI